MKFFSDTSSFFGLFTLVILEIILGIDNLIFISMLSNKLIPEKRNNARLVGIFLSLIIKLIFFSFISCVFTLNNPILKIFSFLLSGRDIILLCGGIFLIFKSITELHKRLDHKKCNSYTSNNYSSFWSIVLQIVVLDAFFSLDSVITAVGIVNKLYIMMIAVIISMFFMLLTSKFLTKFINKNQTIIVLCLSFLLMIGISLLLEGCGLYIPKGYLYCSIGFSVLIEIFNQIYNRNLIKNKFNEQIKKNTSEIIIKLIVKKNKKLNNFIKKKLIIKKKKYFVKEEIDIIKRILSLNNISLKSVMTPRSSISWINCQKSINELKSIFIKSSHNIFPVCDGNLDKLIGTIKTKDLIKNISNNFSIKNFAINNPAIIINDNQNIFKVLKKLINSKENLVIIYNEFGIIQGLITYLDIFKVIFKKLPN